MGDDNTLGGYPVRDDLAACRRPARRARTSPGEAIFGSWTQLILCFWGDAGADILVNPVRHAQYAKGNVQIRAFVDCDVVIRHPEAFVTSPAIAIA